MKTYTTHEAARLCGVTPMTIIRWIDGGGLPASKTAGGHRRIQRSELETYCRKHDIALGPDDAVTSAKLRVEQWRRWLDGLGQRWTAKAFAGRDAVIVLIDLRWLATATAQWYALCGLPSDVALLQAEHDLVAAGLLKAAVY